MAGIARAVWFITFHLRVTFQPHRYSDHRRFNLCDDLRETNRPDRRRVDLAAGARMDTMRSNEQRRNRDCPAESDEAAEDEAVLGHRVGSNPGASPKRPSDVTGERTHMTGLCSVSSWIDWRRNHAEQAATSLPPAAAPHPGCRDRLSIAASPARRKPSPGPRARARIIQPE